MKENLIKMVNWASKNGTNLGISVQDIEETVELNFESKPKMDFDDDSVIIWERQDKDDPKLVLPNYFKLDKILHIEEI